MGRDKAIAAVERHGAGAAASRLVTGSHPLYGPLEEALARGPERPTIIMLHQHPFDSGIPYIDKYKCRRGERLAGNGFAQVCRLPDDDSLKPPEEPREVPMFRMPIE